jgi:hypothetical protein
MAGNLALESFPVTQEPHRNRDSKSSAAHCFCHAKYTHVSQTGLDPLWWFFRESDEPLSGSRPGSRVSFQAAEAYSTRCLNKSNFPRPYIERLMNLSLFTRPSVCP